MNRGASTTAAKDGELWSIRGLFARHKLVASAAAAVVALLLATIIVPIVGAKGGAVGDSTTCTQWGSANVDQQAAYGRLYLREHGPPRGGGNSAAGVIAAINNGCAHAYADDVSDTTTVVQAISGRF